MATNDYMIGRKKYSRPQGLIFADNPGFLDGGKIVPEGSEMTDFIILSDDNRAPIEFDTERLESRQRTINGRMRSYHIADKLKISSSYKLLPSRAFSEATSFSSATGKPDSLVERTLDGGVSRPVNPSGSAYYKDQQYTTDGGAGGLDLLDWYESHQGSFWVYLSYDKYNNLNNEKNRLSEYSEVVEVFFSNFTYSVEARGGSNHDFWNISFSLEEV